MGRMKGEMIPQFMLGIGRADNEYFLCILKRIRGIPQESARQVYMAWPHGARPMMDVASALVPGVDDGQLGQFVTCNAIDARDVMIDPNQLMEGLGRGCHDVLPFG
jgi:hypothetical protein